jgi:hypothetical protein
MTPNLTEFLHTDELDILMMAASQLTDLSDEGYQAVQTVLDDWNDPQSVANVLMHAQLVVRPEQLGAVLIRGLNDNANPYLMLAATIGLQEKAGSLSEAENAQVRARLLQLVVHADPAISTRASTTYSDYLAVKDAERAIALLVHPNPNVQHNLLVALVKVIGAAQIRPTLAKSPAYQALAPKVRTAVTEKLAILDEITQPDGSINQVDLLMSSLGAPLLSYIPNMKDF